ncbi:uncharacterized protein TOL2_C17390 [Desulfobacula toluolica Tol2]|uniref:Uncharacterized protein n=1 Tax=Desulfobacula toluolica (strain DSM 7467 / Tol2) TaxID=651182 RepID=K0NG38_DESTT|nr:uncharacterized protein TOL2_C17390 [Desulfobacula toluolica Tol2]
MFASLSFYKLPLQTSCHNKKQKKSDSNIFLKPSYKAFKNSNSDIYVLLWQNPDKKPGLPWQLFSKSLCLIKTKGSQ